MLQTKSFQEFILKGYKWFVLLEKIVRTVDLKRITFVLKEILCDKLIFLLFEVY